ncbi:MAG: citrate synthase [Vicinamibacterales bacterium]
MSVAPVSSGLDGVVVAETVLSLVDGEAGELIIRGARLPELVADGGFEGAAARLWQGLLPEGGNREGLLEALGRARRDAFLARYPESRAEGARSPVETLRAALAALADPAPAPHLRIMGTAPVVVAAAVRASRGLSPVAPDPSLTTAADFLRMLRGEVADLAEVAALDAYLTTVVDHGLNASTFTARVIASTQAGLVSAVVGALCALQGPLHGGAPGPVLDMLDAVAAAGDADAWIDAALARGERLMGFGHRVYKVRDPRADVLRQAAASLRRTAGRLALAADVERAAVAALARRKPGLRLDTNVEFYTAVLLEALGIPRDAFTAVFAIGRTAGWIAHAREQAETGRLIRPQSVYVGPPPASVTRT